MKKILQCSLLFVSFLLLSAPLLQAEEDIFVQTLTNSNINANYKNLTLSMMLSQGISESYEESQRKLGIKLLEIGWKNTKDSFFFPHVTLSLVSSEQRMGTLSGAKNAPKAPTGSLKLDFGEYTLFNWGKDYLQYLNKKNLYTRGKEQIKEAHREFRQELIIKYVYLLTLKDIEKNRRDQLRQTAFIYRFNKERAKQKKISQIDLLLIRDYYLKAQTEYQIIKVQIESLNEEIAFLIKDPVGTKYVISEVVNFQKITTPLNELLTIAKNNTPEILDSKSLLINTKRDYELAIKEDLPLPKISLNLGAYEHLYGSGYVKGDYVNGTGKSLEIVASINATWTIIGDNGFLNQRKRAEAFLKQQYQLSDFRMKQHQSATVVHQYYKKIKNSEKIISILQTKRKNSKISYDFILDRYMSKKSTIIYLKEALTERTYAEEAYVLELYEHLKNKVLLAKTIGTYDFPSENFNFLVKKID